MQKCNQAQAIALEDDQFSTVMETLSDCMEDFSQSSSCGCKKTSNNLLAEALRALERAKSIARQQMERLSYLENLAVTDELTGLFNRRGFTKAMERTLSNARRYDEKGVLLFIDLNGFKPVNDTYGHDAGDEVLRQTSRLLIDNIRDNDYAGRLGGDEFAVLLVRTNWDNGITRAKALDRVLNRYYTSWEGRMIGVGASIGAQVYDGSSLTPELLKHADQAMYQAKRLGDGPRLYLETAQHG